MCARSRYLILSGFLTYVVLLMRYPKIRVRVCGDGAGSVARPIVFRRFVAHNFLNYVSNGREQARLERMALHMPWGGY